ncbi:hypothetical protein CK203_117163 [Vitis vinifera]|uniref:Uncharacterized protein n=1 Tax=Vitis vinifera TaxID=29760 RepID=A0A438F8V4_VITVI|nr:hypothetical protein CK203_117163 [Vitis vinifera]
MAKTRGVKTPSPSACSNTPRASLVRDSMIEPQQPAMQPSEYGVPPSPPQRRYQTRRPPTTLRESSSRPKKSSSRPPMKKARVSSDLWLLSHPWREIWIAELDHSTLSYVLTERLSDTNQSLEIHSTYFRGARHIVEALRIPYEPVRPADYREWAHPS